MPGSCCVPTCTYKGSGHRFPTNVNSALWTLWRDSIRNSHPSLRDWLPATRDARVCINHFLPSDFNNAGYGDRRRLMVGAIPSVFNVQPEQNGDEKHTDEDVTNQAGLLGKGANTPPSRTTNRKRAHSDVTTTPLAPPTPNKPIEPVIPKEDLMGSGGILQLISRKHHPSQEVPWPIKWRVLKPDKTWLETPSS